MEMDSITAASLMSFFMKSSREIHIYVNILRALARFYHCIILDDFLSSIASKPGRGQVLIYKPIWYAPGDEAQHFYTPAASNLLD
jgi:hypothetical protein